MKTKQNSDWKGVWVFGDYRNYFQNRVTLQLIAKGKQLAGDLHTDLTVLLLGSQIHQYAMEYTAHGADAVIVVDHPNLNNYQVETYVRVVSQLVGTFKPEIFLAGATAFGREFFPRLAKRLNTGLSADCVALEIETSKRMLIQTTPAFGGELLADIVTPEHRPQMATVHPGVFEERTHDHSATARILYPEVEIQTEERVQLLRSKPDQSPKGGLEEAEVVLVGGKGLGSRESFQTLFELARLLGGDVGATRPVILSGWADEGRLLGQTGKSVKPKLLITAGTSGAVQFTTGIQGLVGDAKTVLSLLLEKLRKRL
jgi:electron transfer flavoprotein alpha subunit